MNILIKNATILPMDNACEEHYFRGDIAIKDHKIYGVDKTGELSKSFLEQNNGQVTVIEADGMIAMPGLINLHNHVSMSIMRSYADDMLLMPWLQEKIWPLEAKLTDEHIYWGAKLGIAEMLLGGTTSFVDMYWNPFQVARAVDDCGIRGVLSPVFVDNTFDNYMREIEPLIGEYENKDMGRVRIAIGPHALYTCSAENIRSALKYASKYDLLVHTHLAETLDETNIIRTNFGKTPVEYAQSIGLFDHPLIAAHCVHVTEKDMDIMKQYQVNVAHNPQSNMKLASGISPVAQMLDKGLNVGIGTDGPSSNNDLDMWDEMRTASLLQKVSTMNPCALPAYQVLEMVTKNGAKALGKENQLGQIKKDFLADIILIKTDAPHMNPQNNLISNLVYSAKSADVDTVIINGRIVVRRREFCTFDYQLLLDKLSQISVLNL